MVTLISDRIRTYLTAQGYSNVVIYELQDTSPGYPPNQIVLIPRGPSPPDGFFGGDTHDKPIVSVVVYDDDLSDAETTCENIRVLFKDKIDLPGSIRVRNISSHVQYLGRDESKSRYKFQIELDCYV